MRIGTERISKLFPKWLWFEHLTRYNFAAKYVGGKKVIDCACGSGMGSYIFLREGADHLNGFDLSKDAIEKAKKRCASFANAEFAVADAMHIPAEDSHADVFVSLETIEHISSDNLFLKEVSRTLKKGGVFICSTPCRTVTNPGTSLEEKPWNKFHEREYSREEFEYLLGKEFSNIKMYGFNKISKSRLSFENIIRKNFFLNGYIWTNIKKLHKVFLDNIDNYAINLAEDGFEYEYYVAVCIK